MNTMLVCCVPSARALKGSATAASVPAEGHGLLVRQDVLKEGLCPLGGQAADCVRDLTAVLEVHAQVVAAGLHSCEER